MESRQVVDGEPVVKADFQLGYKVDCDRTTGATSYDGCDKIASVDFIDDTSYKVTYVPGYQYAFYYLSAFSTYPSHQPIKSEGPYKGKTLNDVAPKDFATLPELAETPLGTGPYVLQKWDKGQKMTLVANKNYIKGEPKVKKVVVQFFGDTTGAVRRSPAGCCPRPPFRRRRRSGCSGSAWLTSAT